MFDLSLGKRLNRILLGVVAALLLVVGFLENAPLDEGGLFSRAETVQLQPEQVKFAPAGLTIHQAAPLTRTNGGEQSLLAENVKETEETDEDEKHTAPSLFAALALLFLCMVIIRDLQINVGWRSWIIPPPKLPFFLRFCSLKIPS